jgi:hypothetical protein
MHSSMDNPNPPHPLFQLRMQYSIRAPHTKSKLKIKEFNLKNCIYFKLRFYKNDFDGKMTKNMSHKSFL